MGLVLGRGLVELTAGGQRVAGRVDRRDRAEIDFLRGRAVVPTPGGTISTWPNFAVPDR